MDLEQKAIQRIQTASGMSLHHYGKPLICTYSGGKDSDVMLELFKRAKVPFQAHHSHTTADAPQTVRHIRATFHRLELEGITCSIDYHRQEGGSVATMWNLIPKKMMPPTRIVRYCCSELKESSCAGRMIATGIRWEESRKREGRGVYETLTLKQKDSVAVSDEKMLLSDNDSARRLFERCRMKGKTTVNPIIDWKDHDIWEYYWKECRHHNPLYQMGYFRVGCIGCPMAGKARKKEFADFPAYKQAYIKAFQRMLEVRQARGLGSEWKSGEEVFFWWMEDENVPGQISMDEYLENARWNRMRT